MAEFDFERSIPIFASIIAFALGSVPFGLIVARVFKGKDITKHGSGNIGATNVSRVLGFWPAGALTLFLDIGKGTLAVFLVHPFGIFLWGKFQLLSGYEFSTFSVWLVGLFAVLGHCYSPWLHFKGGKGVATGLGTVLLLSPIAAAAGIAAFIITFFSKRTGSLASIAGLLVASTTHVVFEPVGAHLWLGAIMVFIILLRHESNITALLENRENTF